MSFKFSYFIIPESCKNKILKKSKLTSKNDLQDVQVTYMPEHRILAYMNSLHLV